MLDLGFITTATLDTDSSRQHQQVWYDHYISYVLCADLLWQIIHLPSVMTFLSLPPDSINAVIICSNKRAIMEVSVW